MPPEVLEVWRWVEKADHDFAGAQAAMRHEPPITDVAAFHCQQAVEKLFKAYLVYRREPFERTHDLVELLAKCSKYDDSLNSLKELIEPLTPFAVRFRYPGPADPTVQQVQAAILVVEQVQTVVREKLPPIVDSMEDA